MSIVTLKHASHYGSAITTDNYKIEIIDANDPDFKVGDWVDISAPGPIDGPDERDRYYALREWLTHSTLMIQDPLYA